MPIDLSIPETSLRQASPLRSFPCTRLSHPSLLCLVTFHPTSPTALDTKQPDPLHQSVVSSVRQIVADTSPSCIILKRPATSDLASIFHPSPTFTADEILRSTPPLWRTLHCDGSLSGDAGPENACWMYPTSGSTGPPKYVVAEHRSTPRPVPPASQPGPISLSRSLTPARVDLPGHVRTTCSTTRC